MTDRISQQVENNSTSPSLDKSVSFEIIPAMTQGDDHVADHDADDDEDQGQTMAYIQESFTVGRARRNLRKPSWLTTNMIVAYALSVIEKAISSSYREEEISSKSKM